MASMLTLKPDRPQQGRPSKKPLALLHKLAAPGGERGNGGDDGGGAAGAGGAARPDPLAADSRLLLEDGEPLEEGQLLSFSIALSQVVGVELCEERRIKVRWWELGAAGLGLLAALTSADGLRVPSAQHQGWRICRCRRSAPARRGTACPAVPSPAGAVCAAEAAPQH